MAKITQYYFEDKKHVQKKKLNQYFFDDRPTELSLEELNKRNKAQVETQLKGQETIAKMNQKYSAGIITGNDVIDTFANATVMAIKEPFETLAKGIMQLGTPPPSYVNTGEQKVRTDTNPIAGAVNVATGIVETGMLMGTVPLSNINAGLNEIGLNKITEPVNKAFEVVQKAPQNVAQGITDALEKSGAADKIRQTVDNITGGTPRINPKTAQEITEAVNNATGLASITGLALLAGETYKTTKENVAISKNLKESGYSSQEIKNLKVEEAKNILQDQLIKDEVKKAEITQKADQQIKEQIIKEIDNAERLRENEGSVQEGRSVSEISQSESGKNLEQQTPEQSGIPKEQVDNNLSAIQDLTSRGRTPEEISTALNIPIEEVKTKIEQPKVEVENVIQKEVQGWEKEAIETKDAETVGITKEKLNELRTNVGLPELEKTARQSIPETVDKVKANLEQGFRTPEMIMRDVETGNIKPETSFEASYLLRQEKNRFDKYTEQLNEAKQNGDLPTQKLLQSLIETSQKNFDSMTKAFNQPNTDWGRFGRYMQELFKEDYSLERVVKRAQAESPTGEIPTDIRTKLGDYVNQLDKVRNAIDTFQQKSPNATIEDFIKSVTEKQRFVERKTRRGVTLEQLKTERGQLWTDLYKQTNVAATGVPLTPEAIKTMGKLAENYVRTGITSVEGLVDEFYNGFKGRVSKDDIMKAISGYGKESTRTKNEILQSLNLAKREMRLLLKIEDARKGIEPNKQSRNITPKPERIQNLEKILKNLTKQNIDISDAQKLQAQKTRVKNNISDYQRRLQEGDYAKKERKPVQADQELTGLRLQERQLKQKIELELYKQKRANMTTWEKTKDISGQVANIPRTLMATFDLSMPLRQGLPATFANPSIGAKAFREMHKAAVSPEYFDTIMNNIENSPNARVYEKMGVQFTGIGHDLVALAKQEEAFIASKILNKIPIIKQTIGAGVRASERGAIANLNLLRQMTSDKMIKMMESKGMTPENNLKTYQDVGKVINWMTGRADLGMFERVPGLANAVMFSPRTFVAKWELMNPINYLQLAPEARKLFIKAQMATVAQGMIFLNLMKLGGATVETDPRSSDFGKARFGDTRIDMFGGNLQNFVFATRLAFGIAGLPAVKPEGGEPYELGEGYNATTLLDLIVRYGRNKLSPQAGLVVDKLAGKTTSGEDFSEYYKNGMLDKFIPLVWQDIVEAQAELGFGAMATGLLGFYGAGTQTYKPREKKTNNSKNYNFNFNFNF